MTDARELKLVVVSDAASERNGVGSYYADLVRQLQSRGVTAELICPVDHRAGWLRRLAPPLPGDYTQRLWFPRPIKLWRRLMRAAPDAIVVPTPGPFGMIGMLAARRLGVPLFVGFHTHFEALASIYWASGFGRVCRWYLESCNRLLFRSASVVLANSDEMLAQARKLGAVSPQLMGTSVALEFVQRPIVPNPAGPLRILFAGRLAEEKNLPAVIELARARPGISISIAGDGPLRSLVESAAASLDNLRYLGWVSRTDLIATIDRHDFLLLPSSVESFGTVALESMARGRPPVVSAACGIAEWRDLSAGLFTIGSDESIADAIDRIAALSADERARRSAAARHAALALNDANLNGWLELLATEAPLSVAAAF